MEYFFKSRNELKNFSIEADFEKLIPTIVKVYLGEVLLPKIGMRDTNM